MRPITVARGEAMPAWFDSISMRHDDRLADGDEDEFGMEESLDTIETLIKEEEKAGIPRSRVVVGGFSQGGALAVLQGIKGGEVGGLVVLSGYLPLQWKILQMKSARTNSIPTFWAHGTADQVIAHSIGKGAFETLRDSGMSEIEFHSYKGMPHGFCDEELADLQAWLVKRVPPEGATTKL